MSEIEIIPVLCQCGKGHIMLKKHIFTSPGSTGPIVSYSPPTPCDVCHKTIDVNGRDLRNLR